MAQVVIKLTDLETGGIDVKVDFVPPIEDSGEDFDLSGAQAAALLMIAAVADYAEEPVLND